MPSIPQIKVHHRGEVSAGAQGSTLEVGIEAEALEGMLLTVLLLRLPFSHLPYTLEDRLPRKHPTDTLTGHSDGGTFSNGVSSSQMTLVCCKLTKRNLTSTSFKVQIHKEFWMTI